LPDLSLDGTPDDTGHQTGRPPCYAGKATREHSTRHRQFGSNAAAQCTTCDPKRGRCADGHGWVAGLEPDLKPSNSTRRRTSQSTRYRANGLSTQADLARRIEPANWIIPNVAVEIDVPRRETQRVFGEKALGRRVVVARGSSIGPTRRRTPANPRVRTGAGVMGQSCYS